MISTHVRPLITAFLIFWFIAAPAFFRYARDLLSFIPSGLVGWLPYIAAFLSGLLYAYLLPSNRDRDCILLGLLIGASVGGLNYMGPFFGRLTDLPGLTASLIIGGIASLVSIFLVFAGAGSKGIFREQKPRT